MKWTKGRRAILCLVCMGLFTSVAYAIIYTTKWKSWCDGDPETELSCQYVGGGEYFCVCEGNWQTAANWTGGVPDSEDHVAFWGSNAGYGYCKFGLDDGDICEDDSDCRDIPPGTCKRGYCVGGACPGCQCTEGEFECHGEDSAGCLLEDAVKIYVPTTTVKKLYVHTLATEWADDRLNVVFHGSAQSKTVTTGKLTLNAEGGPVTLRVEGGAEVHTY